MMLNGPEVANQQNVLKIDQLVFCDLTRTGAIIMIYIDSSLISDVIHLSGMQLHCLNLGVLYAIQCALDLS